MKTKETLSLLFDQSLELDNKKKIRKLSQIDLTPEQGAIFWIKRIGDYFVKDKNKVAQLFGIDLSQAPILVSDKQEGPLNSYRRLVLYKGDSGYYYVDEFLYNTRSGEESKEIGQEGIMKLGSEKEDLILSWDGIEIITLSDLLENQVILEKVNN